MFWTKWFKRSSIGINVGDKIWKNPDFLHLSVPEGIRGSRGKHKGRLVGIVFREDSDSRWQFSANPFDAMTYVFSGRGLRCYSEMSFIPVETIGFEVTRINRNKGGTMSLQVDPITGTREMLLKHFSAPQECIAR
ncbi:MAG: hypothetical protein WCW66_06575 [Patescibacteria group bacterium]|jgi:hypothetical protein